MSGDSTLTCIAGDVAIIQMAQMQAHVTPQSLSQYAILHRMEMGREGCNQNDKRRGPIEGGLRQGPATPAHSKLSL